MRKVWALISFFAAFLIGAVPGILMGEPAEAAEYGPFHPGEVTVTYKLSPVPGPEVTVVRAEDLAGVWRGTWGYGGETCSIEINRVDGVKFYGTLRKEGAVITLEGYIDPANRHVHFKETRVVKLGPAMSEWSLGLNSGTFSADGSTLAGEGTDEFGTYGWSATKVKN